MSDRTHVRSRGLNCSATRPAHESMAARHLFLTDGGGATGATVTDWKGRPSIPTHPRRLLVWMHAKPGPLQI